MKLILGLLMLSGALCEPDIFFHLYTRNNTKKAQTIKRGDTKALKESNFNATKPTRFIVHGWLPLPNNPMTQLIRTAILDNCDCNVFILDWGKIASGLLYPIVRIVIPVVAFFTDMFISFLISDGGLKLTDVTMIGHSLGAHISGLVGKHFIRKHQKIQVIIGLDPALPLFSLNMTLSRLSKDDAVYTQTIQTNADHLGFYEPLGHGSFYPNYGILQPGCDFDITYKCSHERAFYYYAESLYASNNFFAYRCADFEAIKNRNCTLRENVRMGEELDEQNYPKGIFFVPVKDTAPYSLD